MEVITEWAALWFMLFITYPNNYQIKKEIVVEHIGSRRINILIQEITPKKKLNFWDLAIYITMYSNGI